MKNKTKPNHHLKELSVLIGNWEMELSNASFLPDPSTVMKGKASIEWLEKGDFLIMRQGNRVAKMPFANFIIGRDEAVSRYSALYFDDRNVSRIYEMSFKGGVWKLWREAPGFSQRYEGKLSKDKKTIKGSWKNSSDGKKWKHDFDLTYRKRR